MADAARRSGVPRALAAGAGGLRRPDHRGRLVAHDAAEGTPDRGRVLVLDGQRRILEIDEKQHFNHFRAQTLQHYPNSIQVGFPTSDWIAASNAKKKLEGGGFAKPRPPLFPEPGGRHQQRAFRDALADILPSVYGWQPTLRIADFEVEGWVFEANAAEHMQALLDGRF